MTVFILAALLITLLAYLVKVIQFEGNSPNAFVVMPLLLGILVSGVMEIQWSGGLDRGTHLVIYVSGKTNSSLDCQRMMGTFYDWTPDKKAYIEPGNPNVVHMKYTECMDLMNWFNSDKLDDAPTSAQANSLHLLIFEANKLVGNVSDHDAECKTDAQYEDVAVYAGATKSSAAKMMGMFKTDWYPQLSKDRTSPCS